MTTYIKLSTLQYPVHEGDIRLEFPEILETLTGEDFPCPDTYSKVKWVDLPSVNSNLQTFYELPPTQINGEWTMVWEIRDLTEEEREQRQIMAGLGDSMTVERL